MIETENGYALKGVTNQPEAKEAYVKLTGQGIDNDFASLCILPEEGVLPEMNSGSASWQAREKCFWQVDIISGYSFCICSESAHTYNILC